MDAACIELPARIDATAGRRLREAIDNAIAGPAKVIALAGKDGVFCEGLDFDGLGPEDRIPNGECNGPSTKQCVEAFADCLSALRLAAKPTMALVDGTAAGGGVGLAAACDVVIASDRSRFSLPEVLFGLVPGVILPILLDRMTIQRCRLWALTGDSRNAEAALAAGLVDEVVAADELDNAGRRWARNLSRGRRDTIGRFKTFAATAVVDREGASTRGIALTVDALQDKTVLARLRRFNEAGLPPWRED